MKLKHWKEKEFNQKDAELAQRIYDELYFVEQIIFVNVSSLLLFNRYIQRISKNDKFRKVINVRCAEGNKVRVMLTGENQPL